MEEGPLEEEYPQVGAWEGAQVGEGVDLLEGDVWMGEVLMEVVQEASCQGAYP